MRNRFRARRHPDRDAPFNVVGPWDLAVLRYDVERLGLRAFKAEGRVVIVEPDGSLTEVEGSGP